MPWQREVLHLCMEESRRDAKSWSRRYSESSPQLVLCTSTPLLMSVLHCSQCILLFHPPFHFYTYLCIDFHSPARTATTLCAWREASCMRTPSLWLAKSSCHKGTRPKEVVYSRGYTHVGWYYCTCSCRSKHSPGIVMATRPPTPYSRKPFCS